VIVEAGVGIGADVGVEEEGLAVFDEAVGVLEVGFALADGLDLCAAEGDSGFEAVGEEVVVGGGAIVGSIALAAGDWVAGAFGFGGWSGAGNGLGRTWHREC
jgi:hypothetical protein